MTLVDVILKHGASVRGRLLEWKNGMIIVVGEAYDDVPETELAFHTSEILRIEFVENWVDDDGTETPERSLDRWKNKTGKEDPGLEDLYPGGEELEEDYDEAKDYAHED